MKILTPILSVLLLLAGGPVLFAAGGAEYSGVFQTDLAPNVEQYERVIFKFDTGERLKSAGPFDAAAHFAAGKLLDPRTQQYSILAYLVEEKGKDPAIFIDYNDDFQISADERSVLKRNADDTFLWNTTAAFPIKEGVFKSCPIFIRYFKSVITDKMSREDRLLTQSTEVMARGKIDVKGKAVLVQYAYDAVAKKISPQSGWLGIDGDENGDIDMDNLSPEAAKANDESVIFRVGGLYLSTKRADISKNQIVLREHEAKDYRRHELYLNKDFPDFSFTDFDGKKRRFSEFRGKYVLLDVWGFWCGPCKRELPYIRESYRRFQNRNLQIVGLNTDENFTVESMKKALNENGMTWTHGQFQSVADFLRDGLRVNSFPTTFLISPDGKILSMSRSERDEPDLRGRDLLTTLDEILPKQ